MAVAVAVFVGVGVCVCVAGGTHVSENGVLKTSSSQSRYLVSLQAFSPNLYQPPSPLLVLSSEDVWTREL